MFYDEAHKDVTFFLAMDTSFDMRAIKDKALGKHFACSHEHFVFCNEII